MAAIPSHCIMLLTVFISFFLTLLVDSNNVEHSTRFKREDSLRSPPDNITIHLTYQDKLEKYTVSKLKNNHIANNSLKIWTVHTRGSEPDQSIMEINSDLSQVGPWVMYQNHNHSSAVVYFPKHQMMMGLLGKKYHLEYVSYTGTEEFNVTISYTLDSKRMKREISKLEVLMDNLSSSKMTKRSVDEEVYESREYRFYVESLVFISGNSIGSLPASFTGFREKKSAHFITHVLSFFNAVDMFFSTLKFRINIAGIVIRQDGNDFPFYETTAINATTQELQLQKANDILLKFISTRKSNFTHISFDLAMCLTDHLIFNEKTNQTAIKFVTYPKEGILKAKENNSQYAYPVIFTPSNLTVLSVQHAADGIFHVIGGINRVKLVNSSVDEASVVINTSVNTIDCYKWNKDWCTFVNEPTSLGNTPRQLVTYDQQCWCQNWEYYFDDDSNNTIADICQKGFECHLNNETIANVTLVMDGTRCDEKKVCWNNECVAEAA